MADPLEPEVGPVVDGPDLRRHLIGAEDPQILVDALEAISQDPRAAVIRRPTADLAVVQAPTETLDALRSRFGAELIIEPDLELDPLEPVADDGTTDHNHPRRTALGEHRA
ncbi:hypothetical protein [Pilimelia columellifera]|uniref:Uncharacterized protein n=1 Tax=Pilimelia columellifera subsp. columellifera TaxID=706583 RepID=A0ABN3NIQ9_9ACTN